ncbi:MAG: aryl-sulfate sulfotransferase [Saprospiraceae bacterium]|nr:aryl-sulfate sulfotransferase [Saprospiraceae bacterium]
MISRSSPILLLGLFLLLLACSGDDENMDNPVLVVDIDVLINPDGIAPLAARLNLQTNFEVQVTVTVKGKTLGSADLTHQFQPLATTFQLPILGLYAGHDNEVLLEFHDQNGNYVDSRSFILPTDPLISALPDIVIDQASTGNIKSGFNLVNYFGHTGSFLPQRPFMFDEEGEIRWYLDYLDDPDLSTLFSDNGLIRLENGNMIFGNGNTATLYEVDMLGQVKNSWFLSGYGFHHTLIEKPNGNFLVTVNDWSKPTVEDVIIEVDRNSGSIVNTWDLTQSLDPERTAWTGDQVDWFHANGLAYDPVDDAIIVSGRTQGIVKLNASNEIIWILAPHVDWTNAGNGTELSQYLLQPLDSGGYPIMDQDILEGTSSHPDFNWTWYQHSPLLLDNGNLMAFDNGENRNFGGSLNYSRAVEFKINDQARTIQQMWAYGEEEGEDAYSRIVSKVEYYPEEDHVLFAPGACFFQGDFYGKVIEVDRSSKQVLFEATVYPPDATVGITFHNVLRMSIYP